ncbi:MAG: hypothetical protein JWQ09_3680 [Segetibacter sp.]|nr:hypothetical protein [Segetibacter sp.]
MKTIILLFVFASGMTGCTKSIREKMIPDGKYTGTFERTRGMGSKESGNVSITFSGNSFTGTSEKPKFPAICNGTYSASGNEIHFTNNCVWTADFDWSAILSNDYTLRLNGDSIEIKREYPGQMTDVYKLKKE